MPYNEIKDTNSAFLFDDCEIEFVSDSEYFEMLSELDIE